MSAVATRTRTGLCVGCGVEFEDLSRTSPRSFCYECRPPKLAVVDEPLRLVEPVAGAFTVEHFREWSSSKRMKDGNCFELEDWQALFLGDVFARDEVGRPLFEELWLIVPEGNGKTTFTSLLVLYEIEHTPEAWCPIAASSRDQGVGLTYRIASGFVERNRLGYKLHPGYREIRHEGSLGTAKIFPSDAASGDGVDPVGVMVIEELHRIGNLDLYETWSGKLDKSGAQLIVVSTAGVPNSPFEDLRERMRREADVVETGRRGCFTRGVSKRMVIHDYSLPADGDPEDLELVAEANPFSAKTVDALREKRGKKSWNLAHWRRFTCNLPTRELTSAITDAEWDVLARPEGGIPEGEPVWVGMDVAWKWDTTAIAPFWVSPEGRRVVGHVTILTPPRDGSMLSSHAIEDALQEIHARNPIHTVVMDPHRAEGLAEWIEEELGVEVIERSQKAEFRAVDYTMWMEAIRLRVLEHDGDQEFRQHVLNAVARQVSNERYVFDRPVKSRMVSEVENRRVIDALDAAAMVHSTAMREEETLDVPLLEVL